ncbi:MAG: hypothetical protein IJ341_02080 [Bacteroidales bacterium]|nr:hypothetical protein [Bacteroidales bacterium]
MKNTFTHKNLIALMLVMLIAFTSLYMAGCDKENTVATPDNVPTSLATIDETTNVTEATIEATTQNTTTAESTASTTSTEATVGETVNKNSATGNSSDNKPSDKVIVTEGNTSPQHIHSYGWVTVKPTCTKDGYTEYSCACGANYIDNYVEAYGHDWSSWKTVKEATTESEGKRQRVCNTCGKVKSESIDKVASPYDASCRSDENLLCERILYYINQYKNVDATSLPKMKQFAEMRAEQLASDFSHNEDDRRSAAEYLQYGKYVDLSHWNDPDITGYWQACSEAIGKSTNAGGSIDEMAKRVADMFYGSYDHWSYVGADDTVYISIGVYFDGPTMYTCAAVGGVGAIDLE